MWSKFDDQAGDHPKLLALSDAAFRLWWAAVLYAGKHLTDGFIPEGLLPRLAPVSTSDWRSLVEELMAGEPIPGRWPLWSREVGGFRIHDYHDYNPRSGDIRAEREAARLRTAINRALEAAGLRGRRRLTMDELEEIPPELRQWFMRDGEGFRRRSIGARDVRPNTRRTPGARADTPVPSPSPIPSTPPSPTHPPSPAPEDGVDHYIDQVLRLYAELPAVEGRVRTEDRRIAEQLWRERVPLRLVLEAILFGAARKRTSVQGREAEGLPVTGEASIRSLRYFLPVIEELRQDPKRSPELFGGEPLPEWEGLEPGYVQYLREQAGLEPVGGLDQEHLQRLVDGARGGRRRG